MARLTALCLIAALASAGCAHRGPDSGWVTLIGGDQGLENFNRIGDVNWRAEGGAIVGDTGSDGYLISKRSYKDFELYAQFWADHTTNSGIFIRVSDPNRVSPDSSYEVNIFDQRPGPEYGTGAIVNFAAVTPNAYKAGGQWNTYTIYARGPELIVRLNGQVTARLANDKFASGPFALQFGSGPNGAPGGAIKWRKVAIREL